MLKKYISQCIIYIVAGVSSVQTLFAAFGLDRVDEDLKGHPDKTLSVAVQDVIVYLLGFLTLIAIIWVMKGGVQILTAGGDEERVKSGKKTVLFVILGIFVIWIAWALVVGVIGGLEENG